MEARRTVLKQLLAGLAAGVGTASVAATARARVVLPSRVEPGSADRDQQHDPAETHEEHGESETSAPQNSAQQAAAEPSAQPEPAPWSLLAPLSAGAHIGLGWSLADLAPARHGALLLTLQHRDGSQGRVHICRHEGSPRGLAHTPHLDLLLMNGGQGDTASREDLGRVVGGLAGVIEKNELRAVWREPQLARLMSHDERLEQFREAGDALS